ncbi:MAG: tRNA (5-methylaminomethyl-2-thiouridine)(34)-methyltransferase MnmD [Bacteroidales bacterium]|nr:tRNA (5-methylaminomethyl-2-thiouridine)(34)-methyltransferase MnmD [Bacteroidales bacterium]
MTIFKTADGSNSLTNAQGVAYHSKNGAVTEAMHIYINLCFNKLIKQEVKILDVGFGTGLNAILTAIEAEKNQKKTLYVGIEKYPVDINIAKQMDYTSKIGNEELFEVIHQSTWGKVCEINNYFSLLKIQGDITQTIPKGKFDGVYYDAFAPDDQPEIWTKEIFSNIKSEMSNNSILVTYCSKGIVKQALRDSGFEVKRFPGPPGKRHVVVAMVN